MTGADGICLRGFGTGGFIKETSKEGGWSIVSSSELEGSGLGEEFMIVFLGYINSKCTYYKDIREQYKSNVKFKIKYNTKIINTSLIIIII